MLYNENRKIFCSFVFFSKILNTFWTDRCCKAPFQRPVLQVGWVVARWNSNKCEITLLCVCACCGSQRQRRSLLINKKPQRSRFASQCAFWHEMKLSLFRVARFSRSVSQCFAGDRWYIYMTTRSSALIRQIIWGRRFNSQLLWLHKGQQRAEDLHKLIRKQLGLIRLYYSRTKWVSKGNGTDQNNCRIRVFVVLPSTDIGCPVIAAFCGLTVWSAKNTPLRILRL